MNDSSVVVYLNSYPEFFNLHTVLAILGSFIQNVVRLLEHARLKPEERPNFREFLYWLPFAVWPVLGGILVYVLQLSDPKILDGLIDVPIMLTVSAFSSFCIGLSCPVLYSKLIKGNRLVLPVKTTP